MAAAMANDLAAQNAAAGEKAWKQHATSGGSGCGKGAYKYTKDPIGCIESPLVDDSDDASTCYDSTSECDSEPDEDYQSFLEDDPPPAGESTDLLIVEGLAQRPTEGHTSENGQR